MFHKRCPDGQICDFPDAGVMEPQGERLHPAKSKAASLLHHKKPEKQIDTKYDLVVRSVSSKRASEQPGTFYMICSMISRVGYNAAIFVALIDNLCCMSFALLYFALDAGYWVA